MFVESSQKVLEMLVQVDLQATGHVTFGRSLIAIRDPARRHRVAALDIPRRMPGPQTASSQLSRLPKSHHHNILPLCSSTDNRETPSPTKSLHQTPPTHHNHGRPRSSHLARRVNLHPQQRQRAILRLPTRRNLSSTVLFAGFPSSNDPLHAAYVLEFAPWCCDQPVPPVRQWPNAGLWRAVCA